MSTVEYPNTNVLLRNLSRKFPVITHGKGIYLYDNDGKSYIDAASGAFVVSVGHGVEEIARAVYEQARKVGYLNGTQFTSQVTESLANEICHYTKPLQLEKCSFLSSGSEAVEAAIKFARQVWVSRGSSGREKLIARTPSYHGNTLFALSASGRPHYKKPFAPLLSRVVTISAPYKYRSPVSNYDAEATDYHMREFELILQREGAESVFAIIVEPVSGSSTGGCPPPKDYFTRLNDICRRYGILIIADEIFVGSGRLGTMTASEQVGLKPDIITLAKGLNGGYAPLSAVVVKNEHVEELRSSMGGFQHAQTFMQNPIGSAAGLAVLQYMRKHDVMAGVQKKGETLRSILENALSDHPSVGNISGCGLMASIEFVQNKSTKQPFERTEKIAEKLNQFSLAQGMTLWPNVGQADGFKGDLVMVGPPLTSTEEEVELIANKLSENVKDFFKSLEN